MSKCSQCLYGYCENCKGCDCQHAIGNSETDRSTEKNSVEEIPEEVIEEEEETNWRLGGATTRRHKRNAAIRDQQSTGRKRAAKLYPLDRSAACEWQNASPDNSYGGGNNPITRPCKDKQQARHHGPDKNTLNNEKGNVHRICHHHHNSWHAANDPDYVLTLRLKGD